MKKQLLLVGLAGIFMSAVAGDGATKAVGKYTPIKTAKSVNAPKFRSIPLESAASRSSRTLNKTVIGSSGNLISVTRATSNAVDANDSINTVTFIYRSDSLVNLSRYKFSVSKDGGSTWNVAPGFLNRLHTYSNPGLATDTNSRYPQGAIYRAPGVTEADSAYIVYTGTWHNAGIWSGETRGAGKLNGDTTTYKAHASLVAGGAVTISNSLVVVGDKTFALQEQLETPSATGGTTVGTVVMKGTWNSTTRNVDWTETILSQEFEMGTSASMYANPTIAFDPSGQIGYIVVTGDIIPNDGIVENKPFYYKSTDGGDTWTGPTRIDLDAISGFGRTDVDDGTGNVTPTSINVTPYASLDVVVDYLGRPHIAVAVWLSTVENYAQYYPFYYGISLFDLTLGELCDGSEGWVAKHVKELHSTFSNYSFLIGEEGADVAHTDNNRLQASRSADGKYLFFFWGETDSAVAVPLLQSDLADNPSPDLYGVGIDVENSKVTTIKNFTEGDPVFGGATNLDPYNGGSAGGATFSYISPNVLTTATGFNVPVTLTEADYNHPGIDASSPKNSSNPAKHYYLQNIDFALSEFSVEASDLEPPLFSNVPDTIFLHLDSTFTAPGITAVDCHDGDVTDSIHVTNNVDNQTIGEYTVTYSVSDSAGNTAEVTVPVLVAAEPVALIAYTQITGNRYQYRDSSLNLPTYRRWTFSNGSAPSTEVNVTKTFSNPGVVDVCLQVSNAFGEDSVCKAFTVTISGIENIELSNSVSVYPTTSNGQITVAVNKEMAEDMIVSIYNIAGAKVSADYTVKRNTSSANISLNVASGLYTVKIGNDKEGYTVKPIVVQK